VKLRRGLLIALLALSLPASSELPQARALALKATLVELKVKSPEKDFPIRNVWVWTPAVPATEINQLPVVYMLHGWPGSPNGMIAGVVAPLAAAFAKGASPFIAVFPDGNALTHADSEWADSYDGRAMIETWLTTNVIKTVEAGNIRDRSDRALLGFSMGGYGAGIIGLHHPNLYGQVITLAGYFVIDDLTNAFGGSTSHPAKTKYQTPTAYLKVASKVRWFLGESPQDYTELIRGQAAAWGAKLKTVKANYTVHPADGGHTYTFVSNEIPAVAKWLKWSPSTPIPTPQPVPSSSATITPPTAPTPTPTSTGGVLVN
jgi:S-formylglutathione hydrolase FrmB